MKSSSARTVNPEAEPFEFDFVVFERRRGEVGDEGEGEAGTVVVVVCMKISAGASCFRRGGAPVPEPHERKRRAIPSKTPGLPEPLPVWTRALV